MEPTAPLQPIQPKDDAQLRIAKLKLLGVVLVFAFLVIAGLSIYNDLRFHIVNTNPATSQVSTDSPFLKLNFNKALSSRPASVYSSDNIIKSYAVSGKTLTIDLNFPLQANKVYTITVASIYAAAGDQISNKYITFSPQDISYDKLPADQQKAIVQTQDHNQPAQGDPILSHLPYSTIDFSLNPTFNTGNDGKEQLVIQCQLLLAPGVSGTEATNDEAQYKQEALSYIQSLGLNPANYNIQYQVVNESLSPAGQ